MNPILSRLGLVGGLMLAGTAFPADDATRPEEKHDTPSLLSAHLKAALDDHPPAFVPPPPAPAAEVDAAFQQKLETAGDDILHLPKLVIKGPRPLQPDEVVSTEGKMDRYLGPKDGLDRGVLNFRTLNLGVGFVQFAFFNAMTNEDRAKEAYRDEKRQHDVEELQDFASRLKLIDQATAALVKEQSDGLNLRTNSLGRTSRAASPQTAVSDQK
ncbi:MAG TPA: hypothetical protein VHD61_06825 [Lacunisphaera sp.]|nr:hypothetical protein [Lacunisphaera sp.]